MDVLKPMLATTSHLPINEEDYAFEVKWDGIRAILQIHDTNILLLSRNQKNITLQFPELQALKINYNVVLDGEIVALDSSGKPCFSLLQQRLGLSSERAIALKCSQIPIVYMLFDILFYKNEWIIKWPYWKRRKLLDSLKLAGANWQTPAYQQGKGQELLQAVKGLQLEGIVAKGLDSPYLPGQRSSSWLKIKIHRRQEFVIGGWVPGKGTRSQYLGALLLGYYSPTTPSQKLRYAGKVGTGFNSSSLQALTNTLAQIQNADNPFQDRIPDKNAIFVKPLLVAEVEFSEWTPARTLRHPSFKGLRQDKAASSVVKEE